MRGVLQPGVVVFLAGITLLPEYRWLLMVIGGVCWLPAIVAWPAGETAGFVLRIGSVAAVLVICSLLLAVIGRWPGGIVARNPRLTLLGVFGAAVTVACHSTGEASDALWSLVAAFAASIWFFSFLLTERPSKTPAWRGGALMFSLWSTLSSSVPFLPRASAMRKLEAKSAEEFAVVQLKGLKLLAWSILLAGLAVGFQMLETNLEIPPVSKAIAASAAGHPYPWYTCWAALLAGFAESVLSMAAWGNTIVAGCRLAGFRLLRNTYRPMESRTIADFWNRYYFYFKELIVDFFFYPVYMSCFKKHPRARMLFATWVAVGLGIPIFHFIRDIHYVKELGFWKSVTGDSVFLFYALMLSVAIGVSQIRKSTNRGRAARGWFRAHVIPTAGVILFFCFLQIFEELGRTSPLRDHFLFVGRLFGWKG